MGARLNIVMEYVNGGTLQDKVEAASKANRLLPEADVLCWIAQAMDAVRYMHSKHIVHR